MWTWIGRNEKQIKIAFALVAALYAAFEYRSKVESDRVEKAMTFVDRYDAGEVQKANMRLSAFWQSAEVADWMETVTKESYHSDMLEMLSAKDLRRDVYELLMFYRSASLCAHSSLCDQSVMCRFFFSDIQAYRETYRALLEHWAGSWGETATEEVKRFVELICREDFLRYCEGIPVSPYCSEP